MSDEIAKALRPFVSKDQEHAWIRTFMASFDDLTPVNITVTKGQFKAADTALTAYEKAGSGISEREADEKRLAQYASPSPGGGEITTRLLDLDARYAPASPALKDWSPLLDFCQGAFNAYPAIRSHIEAQAAEIVRLKQTERAAQDELFDYRCRMNDGPDQEGPNMMQQRDALAADIARMREALKLARGFVDIEFVSKADAAPRMRRILDAALKEPSDAK